VVEVKLLIHKEASLYRVSVSFGVCRRGDAFLCYSHEHISNFRSKSHVLDKDGGGGAHVAVAHAPAAWSGADERVAAAQALGAAKAPRAALGGVGLAHDAQLLVEEEAAVLEVLAELGVADAEGLTLDGTRQLQLVEVAYPLVNVDRG